MMENKFVVRKLNSAIKEGDVEKIKYLLADDLELLNMETPLGSWLHIAARCGHINVIEQLISFGMDVNKRGGVSGGNALNLATSEGHLEIVKVLFDKGAELDVSEPERNPLFGAIHKGYYDIAKYLIDVGMDTKVKYTGATMKDMDALAFAHEWGRADIANLLIENHKG